MPTLMKAGLALIIGLSLSTPAWAGPADEVGDLLARAQLLYYEADFAKSIELLLRADELLRGQSGHTQKADVKLQLALGYIGINERAKAKSYFSELYAIDPDRQIDPQVFSPKVIQLADEARAEQNEARCRAELNQAQEHLLEGNSDDVLKMIESNRTKCPGLAAFYPKVAEILYMDGLDAYKKSQMKEALHNFQAALRADSKHDMAAQYLDLTKSRLEIAAGRALLAWRSAFNAGNFEQANRNYLEILSQNNPEMIEEVRRAYRTTLSGLVDSWNAACAKSDASTMEAVRQRFEAIRPEPAFGQDILANMTTCLPTGCLQVSAPLALTRLKTRVDPVVAASIISQVRGTSVTIRVKTRISETGDVVSSQPQGGNPFLHPAVRNAVDQWKFSPSVVQGQARCVDTEIPLVINFSTNTR